MMENRPCLLTPHRLLRIICMIILLDLVSGGAQAQMGVATGGGVAVPAQPLPAGMKAPVIDYRDIAADAGLSNVNTSGSERGKLYIIESTGMGIAIVDYDNDGLPDIFMVNGGRLQANKTAPAPFSLYHNLGGLKFEDVTKKAGLTHAEGWGQGVCAGDIDNDGHVDLFVTQWGQNILYHNQGDGTFRDETKERRLATPQRRWSTGCAFVDFWTWW